MDLYREVIDDHVDLDLSEVLKFENLKENNQDDFLDDVITTPIVPLNNLRDDDDLDDDLSDKLEGARYKAEMIAKQAQDSLAAGKTSQSTSTDYSTLGISFDPNKKNSFFIGNLTWWTTDVDLVQLLKNHGFKEVKAIKFFENKANGQSKGYALVELKSEQQAQEAVDKLKDCLIHSQAPILALAYKISAHQFEQKSRESTDFKSTKTAGPIKAGQVAMKKMTENKPYGAPTIPNFPSPAQPIGVPGYPVLPPLPPMLPADPLMPGPSQLVHQMHPHVPHPGLSLGIPHHQLPPVPPMPPPAVMPGVVGLHNSKSVAPHVNPAFFGANPNPADMFAQSMQMKLPGAVEEANDSYQRNRAFTNSAMQRAISDANAGDYDSAVDTIRTAISLIKHSSSSGSSNSQMLIQLLQECLKGIERKLQGGHSSRSPSNSNSKNREHRFEREKERGDNRDKERERDRERDRDNNRHAHTSSRYVNTSTSNIRHYPDRSREKPRPRH